jgi:hypothetical protein
MAIINTLRKQIDLPVFEWTRFAPAVSTAVSSSCTADNIAFSLAQGRFIYYLLGAGAFWRYDTYADSYSQMSSPPIAVSTFSTMRYSSVNAIESNIISATSSDAVIPAYYGTVYKGYDIKIVAGTGAGQRRTITNVSDPIIFDQGNATAVTNTLGTINITDTLKAWTFNQWTGYQVRIIQGSGAGQVRKILYNNATQLFLGDSVTSGSEIWCNPMLYSPAIAAGSIYQIEASTITVDTNWLVTPDATSRFKVQGGTIYLFSSNGATPFYSLQHYDALTDTWYIRTANSANVAAVGTDASVERTGEGATIWARTTSTVVGTSMTQVVTGTNTTLTDSGQAWTTNQWAGYYIRIFSGTGEGQLSLIASNTATTLTFASMTVAPGPTSQYFIEGFDAGIASGAGSTTTLVDSTKNWAVNRWKNYAVEISFGTGKGNVVQILSNTATTLTFYKPIPAGTDATSVYTIQGDNDKLYAMLGNNAGVLIQNLNADLSTYTKNYDSGVAAIGAVQYASNKPIALTTLANVTTTATVTTAINHNYKIGQSVVVSGAINAAFNGTFTIATVPSLTTFTYTMGSTPASTLFANSLSTTVIVDSTKNWTVNQWAGYIVTFTTTAVTASTGVATGQAFQIASNTATTLTLTSAATIPTNGVTRYVIGRREEVIGNMFAGIATGASQATTTLQDTNVSSFSGTGSISNFTMTITLVTAGYLGIGSVMSGGGTLAGTMITAIGPNTFGGVGTYTVSRSQSVGSGTLTSTGWAVNIFAGRRLKFLTGAGQQQEALISSNTTNVLTFGAVTAPVAASTVYSILQQPIRGTGIELNWTPGTNMLNIRGKFIFIPRGGGLVNWDLIDLTTSTFDQIAVSPQAETLSTGSMYAYDGGNRIYFTKDVTQRLYYMDVTQYTTYGAGVYPYLAGSAIIGNRMEVFTTVDGLKYLWLNRHANTECYRELLFF